MHGRNYAAIAACVALWTSFFVFGPDAVLRFYSLAVTAAGASLLVDSSARVVEAVLGAFVVPQIGAVLLISKIAKIKTTCN